MQTRWGGVGVGLGWGGDSLTGVYPASAMLFHKQKITLNRFPAKLKSHKLRRKDLMYMTYHACLNENQRKPLTSFLKTHLPRYFRACQGD